MQWFKFYQEFSVDPKVQMMSEAYQRRLVMLFCNRCNENVTLHDNEVTFLLRISDQEWAETKAEFIKRGFIDCNGNVTNWDKRQERAKSSAERVREHREKKKALHVTNGNENVTTVTPLDKSRIEKNRKKDISNHFETFWAAYPRREGNPKKPAAAKFAAAVRKGSTPEEIITGAKRYQAQMSEAGNLGTPFIAQAQTWLNQERWKDDFSPKGATKDGYFGL